MPLAGDGEICTLHAFAQADQLGDEVEAGRNAGPERDEPTGQPTCRATARHVGDVDARLTPVAVRHRRRDVR